MSAIILSAQLKQEYETLFNTCVIRPERIAEVEKTVALLLNNRSTYQTVFNSIGVPWYFVGAVHNMESSLNFKCHLHNGDPLIARTVHVPQGRPKTGTPPFTWDESACDALTMRGLNTDTDWSLAGTLFQLEAYNGWGYRLKHPATLTPYLWSYSSHYRNGKFVADGQWSETAVSKQCGAAVILRRLVEMREIDFCDQPLPLKNSSPLIVPFATVKFVDPAMQAQAVELQKWLNTFAGVFVKVDGIPGTRTADAYHRVTGSYLPGDPNGTTTDTTN